jgi:glutathione S-transferase
MNNTADSGRVLWGAGTSRTIRPHWALQELGLEYTIEPILPRTNSMKRADFVALSQRGKVPLLDDGGVLIGESAAIVLYLADRYGSDACRLDVPVDSDARAAYYDLCFFILTELDATSLYVVRRHEGLPGTYGEAPNAVAAARAYFERQIGEIERRLADGRPHLLGDAFTSPDLLLTTCLDWATFVEVELPDSLVKYRDRIAERPAYSAAMTANFAPLTQLED